MKNYEVFIVEAVCHGGIFCDCGGLMTTEPGRGVLLSNPPKVVIKCNFCGNESHAEANYHPNIQFRKAAPEVSK